MAVCASCKSPLLERGNFCPHCGQRQPRAGTRSLIREGSELDVEDWGKLIVGDRLGEGGMGVVRRGWLYYDPTGSRAGRPHHAVAIKALHRMFRARAKVRKLFVNEANTLESLSHPNIVRFFALVERDGQLAMIVELVHGQPLHVMIDDHVNSARGLRLPCMPFAKAWHYFSQLLGALAAIHALDIIHRDIKPANLLVDTQGMLKVTDFGIARVPQEEVRLTGGMAPGTAAYMAPEQVLGRELDARADLYSAGIVLYEMLAGRTPFDEPGRNDIMLRGAQVEEPAPPLRRFVPQAPEVLDVLLARALAKSPALRFGSAIELGEAIRSAMGLAEQPGWRAQQQFARRAKAVSRAMRRDPRANVAAEAAALRTAMMAAYRRPPGA